MINPSVTVGIPNYNGSRYILYAIESVLRQTYTDFELIISDDGSTDDSLRIIREYENHPNVRIIASHENRGLSYRLNEQIRLAKGKYFCRMDSDDIMLPDRLEKEFRFLKDHPEVDIVGSAAIVIDADNRILGTRLYQINGEYSRSCNGFIHPTIMGKASFFHENQYSEQYSGAEDSELWMRCRKNAVFKVINEPLLFYRDPLELRIPTYIGRLRLIERIFKDIHTRDHTSTLSYLGTIARLEYQKSAVRILNTLGASSLWVKRRNTKCSKEFINHYQHILDEQTRHAYTD